MPVTGRAAGANGFERMEASIRTCRFAETAIQFQSIGGSARRLVQLLFGGLPRENRLPIRLTYQLVQDGGTYQVYRDGELALNTPQEGVAALHLLDGASREFGGECSAGLVLRAACLAYRGKGLLLPGGAGCGKTTLAAWLIQAGFEYLTDELVFLPWRQEGQAEWICQGFNRPLILTDSGVSLFQEAAVLARTSGNRIDTPGGAIIPAAYFYKKAPLPVAPLHEIPLAGIIFPHFQMDAPLSFNPLSEAQAAAGLLNCLVNADSLPGKGQAAVERLSHWIPSFDLRYPRFLQVLPSIRKALG